MKILKIDNKKEKIEILTSLDSGKWKTLQDKEMKNAIKNIKVDGYRVGKVPPAIASKQVDIERVQFYAAQNAINEIGRLIDNDSEVKKLDKEVYPNPSVEITKMDADTLETKFIYFVMPEVTVGDYKKMDIKLEKSEVTDEEVENELNGLISKEKMFSNKENGIIANTDKVVFDFKGMIDDVAFPGGTAEKYELEIGSGQFIPGFEDKMIGLKLNEEKDLNLSFPKEYHAKDLAGKDVVFKVKIHEIKQVSVPKVDDKFVKALKFNDINTVAELKIFIKDNILKFKEQKNKENNIVEINKGIVACSKISEIPKMMLDDEANKVSRELDKKLSQMKIKRADYLKMVGKTEADLNKEITEQGKSNIIVYSALDFISKKEKISITDKEIEEKIASIAQSYNKPVEEVKAQLNPEMLKEIFLHEKVIDCIIKYNTK